MNTKIIITLLMLVGFILNAQNDYEVSVSTQPYEKLEGSTSLNNGAIWNEDEEYIIPLGFNFQIHPFNFDTIFMPEAFAGGVLSSDRTDTGTGPLIVPIGQDLIDLGFTDGQSLTNVSYKTEGTPGQRILKVEWDNVGFYNAIFSNDYCNFQVWLYEESNILEFRYGQSQVNDPNSFDEESGPIVLFAPSYNFATDFTLKESYFLTGDPANPNVLVVPPGREPQGNLALLGMIPEGTVYTFSPKTLSVESVEKLDFQVYPNPTTAYLYIKLPILDYEVAIYNNFGQKLKHTTTAKGFIDVSSLSNGVYFIEIKTQSERAVQKFLKIGN